MFPLRLNRRFFTLLAVLLLCMSFLTITASAEANPPKGDVIIYTSDPTEPPPTQPNPLRREMPLRKISSSMRTPTSSS